MTTVATLPGDVVLILSIEDATDLLNSLTRPGVHTLQSEAVVPYVQLAIDQAIKRGVDDAVARFEGTFTDPVQNLRDVLDRTEYGSNERGDFDQ